MHELTKGNLDPDDKGASADTVSCPPDTATARLAKRLVRIGWWTCVGGLPVTLWGSHLISQGGKNPSDFAHGVHNVGLLIMLAGMVTAFLGYKTPWLMASLPPSRERLRDRDFRDLLAASGPPSRPPRPASSKHSPLDP